MSEREKQEAQIRLGRAGRQGRQAARNAGKAAQLAGEAAAEDTKDALMHAAGEAREVAHDVADTAKRVGPRISTRGLAAISGDTGTGFLALSVALYAGAVAYNKFSAAFQGRGRAVNP